MINHYFLLTGENAFLRQQKRKTYIDGFKAKYADGEVEIMDSDASVQTLQSIMLTPNLFGGKRMLVLDGFWTKEKFEKAEKEHFFDVLATAEDVILLNQEPKLDKRQKWCKYLLKEVRVETFDLLETGELITWATQYASGLGLVISPALAQILLHRCGGDQWFLSQELTKLSQATETGVITEELILQLTLARPEAVIWDFLAALSGQKLSEALKHWRNLMAMGESPHQLLAMLIREIRIHLMLKSALKRTSNSKEIAAATGLHPFVVSKTLSLTQKIPETTLVSAFEELYQVDRRMKRGEFFMTAEDSGELEMALEKVMLQFNGN